MAQPIQHQCSFCKRVITVHDQYDMPIYDPNTGFALCKNCIREINRFLDEHDAAAEHAERHVFADQLDELLKKNKPHIIKQYLDEYIITSACSTATSTRTAPRSRSRTSSCSARRAAARRRCYLTFPNFSTSRSP